MPPPCEPNPTTELPLMVLFVTLRLLGGDTTPLTKMPPPWLSAALPLRVTPLRVAAPPFKDRPAPPPARFPLMTVFVTLSVAPATPPANETPALRLFVIVLSLIEDASAVGLAKPTPAKMPPPLLLTLVPA